MANFSPENQQLMINAGYDPAVMASWDPTYAQREFNHVQGGGNLSSSPYAGGNSMGYYGTSNTNPQQALQNATYKPTNKELAGVGKYNTFLGPDQLQSMMDQRSAAKKEISDAYRDQMRGLNARQHQSARAGYESALRASGASQRSALAGALASRGLQGGFAAAQQGGLEANLANQYNQAANGLMMQDIQLQRQGLDNYSNIVNQQEQEARQNLLNRLTLAVGQKNTKGLSYAPSVPSVGL